MPPSFSPWTPPTIWYLIETHPHALTVLGSHPCPKVVLSVLIEAAYCHHRMILYQHLYTLCRTHECVPLLSIYVYMSLHQMSVQPVTLYHQSISRSPFDVIIHQKLQKLQNWGDASIGPTWGSQSDLQNPGLKQEQNQNKNHWACREIEMERSLGLTDQPV